MGERRRDRADLYTSLVRAKQELNGGVLPAMTPIPEKLHAIIDPAFTIGMGALKEDPEKGLQCPVRGCGEYKHVLSYHLNTKHAGIGGVVGVKRALSIPATARLVSAMESARRSDRYSSVVPSPHARTAMMRESKAPRGYQAAPRAPLPHSRGTVGYKNFRNTCEAQVGQRILTLRDRVGRVPSAREAEALDPGLEGAAREIYGTWNAALAALELRTRARGFSRGRFRSESWGKAAICEAMRAWYERHGSLPTVRQAETPSLAPLIPTHETVLRYFGPTWAESMRAVALRLGIKWGRYVDAMPRRHRHDEGVREDVRRSISEGLPVEEVAEKHGVPKTTVYRWARGMAKAHAPKHPSKSHCPNGHPWDERNTAWSGGRRVCRKCSVEYQRRYRDRKRAAHSEAAD